MPSESSNCISRPHISVHDFILHSALVAEIKVTTPHTSPSPPSCSSTIVLSVLNLPRRVVGGCYNMPRGKEFGIICVSIILTGNK